MARKRRRTSRRHNSSNEAVIGLLVVFIIVVSIFSNFFHLIKNHLFDFKEYAGEVTAYVIFFIVGIAVVIPVYRFIKKINLSFTEERKFEGLRTVSQINDMDHYTFEHFVAYLLKNDGCTDILVTKSSSDGGIDLSLRKNGIQILVQVKHYKEGNNIHRPDLQKFVGAFNHKVSEGWFITTSTYSAGAREYAQDFPNLRLRDRSDVGNMMGKLPDDSWRAQFPILNSIIK